MTKNFPNGILKQKKKAFTQTVALTAIVTMLGQNLAWATCSDGSTLPAGGFVIGQPPVVNPANWSPNVFTAPAQGIFVPDASVNENNDPAQPPTNGGHNWVFDQGSTLCRVVDQGSAAGTTAWQIPPNTSSQCVILPIVKNGAFLNLGDIPFQGQAITPTCDPTLLAQPKFNKNNLPNGQFTKPSTANTYANMLGCALSAFNHPELVSTTFPTTGLPAANTKQNATTYMFVAGIKGGMFVVTLDNTTPSTVPGTAAGKLATGRRSRRPDGSGPPERCEPDAHQHRAMYRRWHERPDAGRDDDLRWGQSALFRRSARRHYVRSSARWQIRQRLASLHLPDSIRV
jgi:hypothetical protein